jgi:hypothetical protein
MARNQEINNNCPSDDVDEMWGSGTALAGSTGPNIDWLYVVMMVSRPASLGLNMAVTQRTLALGVPLQEVESGGVS